MQYPRVHFYDRNMFVIYSQVRKKTQLRIIQANRKSKKYEDSHIDRHNENAPLVFVPCKSPLDPEMYQNCF